jgi:hypothetical protein
MRRKLVLHIDINKTIIMRDPVQGVTLEKMLNALLSECCYGSVAGLPLLNTSSNSILAINGSWKPTPPLEPSVAPRQGLITYADFLENTLCMPKKDRNELKGAFTAACCAGEAFRAHFEALHSSMSLPPGVNLPPGCPDDGHFFLLPSFLRFFATPHARDVVLVFRTYGTDLAQVAVEFNAFCSGRHPLFPNVHLDGTEGSPDFRLQIPHNTAKFHRSKESAVLAFIDREGLVDVTSGFQGIYDTLHQRIANGVHTMGIRDYYPFWGAEGESDTSGKLILVDPADSEHHHVILDDNVEFDRLHIVDVRNVATGEPIPFPCAMGQWVVKVEPLLAITDPDYFIKIVQQLDERIASPPLCPRCLLPTGFPCP